MKNIIEFFKKRKVFVIVAVFVLVGIVLSFSYALWSVTKTQTDNNLVSIGCFDVDFVEVTDAITLSNALPVTDEEGLQTSPYTFTLTNTCNIVVSYQINVEVLPVDNGKTKLADEYVKIDINNSTSILSTNEEVEPTITGASKSYTIKTDILENGESQTFDYRQWLDYDTTTTEGSNKQFKTKITIVAVAFEPVLMGSEPLSSPTATSVFWGGPITRDTVETIEFTTTSTVPAGVTGSWDVSEEQNGKVMAWYTDTDANSKYEVVVGANGGVYAPVNSSNLFYGFHNLNSLDLTNIDTRFVTNMYRMFMYTGQVSTSFSLNFNERFNTSKVTDMAQMFQDTGRDSLAFNLDVSEFDTSNVVTMFNMFSYNGVLNPNFTLTLGEKFDTSKVNDISGLFSSIGYTNTNFILDIRGLNFESVTTFNNYTFATGRSLHKLYTDSSNYAFASSKGFTGTIINCTTSPASCP